MLLRRVIKDLNDQNWTAIGIDFAIVVIGVFVGLQVTTWNEDRIAQSRTANYYERLIDDLNAELRSRQTRMRYIEQTKAHAEAALLALRSPEARLGKEFLIDSYQATQRWVYSPQRTTYDELTAAGIAEAIPDVDLRTQLAYLYVNLESSYLTQQEATPFRDELRRQMPHEAQREIRANCGDRYHFDDYGFSYLDLPATCDIALDDGLIEEAVGELREYEDMNKDLARHVAILDAKLNSLRAYTSPIYAMIESLSSQ